MQNVNFFYPVVIGATTKWLAMRKRQQREFEENSKIRIYRNGNLNFNLFKK